MSAERTYRLAKEKLSTYMIDHPKLRNSAERDYVLRTICELPQPFSPRAVIDRIGAKQDMRISRASVYNVIRFLQSAHIISCYGHAGEATETLYELCVRQKDSFSFICTECGRAASFHDANILTAIMRRKYRNFTPDHATLYIYGTCQRCTKKTVSNKKNVKAS